MKENSSVFKINGKQLFVKSDEEFFEIEQRPKVDVDLLDISLDDVTEIEVTKEKFEELGKDHNQPTPPTLLICSFARSYWDDYDCVRRKINQYHFVTGEWYRRKKIILDTKI